MAEAKITPEQELRERVWMSGGAWGVGELTTVQALAASRTAIAGSGETGSVDQPSRMVAMPPTVINVELPMPTE